MAKGVKKKIRRNVVKAIAHIKATFNNTLITITDTNGDALCRDSSGTVGFKGSRKSTPFAASKAAEKCAKAAMRFGVRDFRAAAGRPSHLVDRGCHADSPQRVPSSQAASRVIRIHKVQTGKSYPAGKM
jgi:hypothetical protein